MAAMESHPDLHGDSFALSARVGASERSWNVDVNHVGFRKMVLNISTKDRHNSLALYGFVPTRNFLAGFRPGRCGPFVPAKGPKTIDAQPAKSGIDGRNEWEDEPTRFAQTRPAVKILRTSDKRAGGRRRKRGAKGPC